MGPSAELDDVVETRKAFSFVRNLIWSLYRLRYPSDKTAWDKGGRLRLKCDGTCAETRFRLPAKRTSPFNP